MVMAVFPGDGYFIQSQYFLTQPISVTFPKVESQKNSSIIQEDAF